MSLQLVLTHFLHPIGLFLAGFLFPRQWPSFLQSITQKPHGSYFLSFGLHIGEKICSTVCFFEFRFFSYHDFQKALTSQRLIKFSFATVEHMLVAWPQTSMCSCGLEKWAGLAQVDSLSQDFTLRVLFLTAAFLFTLWCEHRSQLFHVQLSFATLRKFSYSDSLKVIWPAHRPLLSLLPDPILRLVPSTATEHQLWPAFLSTAPVDPTDHPSICSLP